MDKIFVSVELPDSNIVSAQFLVALIVELNRVTQRWDEEAVGMLAHDAGISEDRSNNALLCAKRDTNKLLLESVQQGSAVINFVVGGVAYYILKKTDDAITNSMELSQYNKRILKLLVELYDISMSTSRFGDFIETWLEDKIIKIRISRDIGRIGNLSLSDDSEVLGAFSEVERSEQLPTTSEANNDKSSELKMQSLYES